MFAFLLVSLFIEASMLMSPAQARMNILERDGRAVYMRRLGLNPPVLDDLRTTCAGICDSLALNATNALLANAGECDQQDVADKLIDVARVQKDSSVTDNLISLAIEYREAEKNTPADDTVSPPVFRNSVYCQKAPKNPELKGLVQSQDPGNDPNAFFDPANPDKTVKLGDQPNTFHFDTAEGDSCDPPSDPTNGGQNGGGNNDGGAGGGDNNGAGGDDDGAGGNDDGAGGNDDDSGGDDDCDDNGDENGDGQQSGDGGGDDDDCDDEPQDGSDPQGPGSPDDGEDTGSGSSGGGYGSGNSGQDGGAPATTSEQPAEAPGGYRTGTAPASTSEPTLTQSSEASASSSVDPKVTASTAPPASTPKHTSSPASSSKPSPTTSLSSSSATSITPSITPTPTTVPTTASTSFASPTPTATDPSAAILLANGKAAQQKNAATVKNPLKDGDPCVGNEVACLGGNVDLGICTQGKFKTFSCADISGSCFAVPVKDGEGISSTCITQSEALGLIVKSGAGNSLTPV